MALGALAMALAIVWWFVYYSQWKGPFELFDVKLGCLFFKSFECRAFQQFIGPSSIPVYQPGMFLGGLIALVGGFAMLKRRSSV